MGRLDAAQFQDSYKKLVSREEIKAPAGSGYRKLQGRVYYLPRLRSVKVFINGTKTATNCGPPISVSETIRWTAGGGDFSGMKAHLKAKMQETYRRLRDRDETLKEISVYITKCNVTGMHEGEFMEKTCTGCVCWYCELANG